MSKKLPLKVYVYREDGNGEDWLQAEESLRECANKDEKRLVGVYRLERTTEVSLAVEEKAVAK